MRHARPSREWVARKVPTRLSRLPLRSPVWAMVAYAALIVGLCVLARDIWPFVAAAFSFQFWTYATYRGVMMLPLPGEPLPGDSHRFVYTL